MPTPGTESARPGLGASAKQVADHARSLVRLELELASLELKRKLAALAVGIALALVGALIALYGLGFLLATIAAALAEFLPTWLALLIVTLVLFAAAGLLVVLGLGRIKRGTPPVPQQAIGEAKATAGALRSNGNA